MEKTEQIIQRLKDRIQQVDWEFNDLETGTVFSVGDGIVFVRGLRDVLSGELVRFEDDTLGMALNLEENQVGIIVLGDDTNIKEDDSVYRTNHIVQTNVGDNLAGRVVDALGMPIDEAGELVVADQYPAERRAPTVMMRRSVDQPLFTGIKIIDSMIPIGKGQRELIIGDRQTGKTAIGINTIINQKGQNVKCVYVAIGQKASTVAQVVETLRQNGAMDYTVVVNSPADDSAAMQYMAPYTGCAIAEYWMDQGEDVLVIYDDLSKHAVAYRTISLLLKRPSGREAYPGDVFYLHSRLLERAAQLNERYGDGSITALPIIETQLGDISSYITTNVISITDGQLFLDSNAFNSGRRPAVDSGLSVSRVGSSAQTQAMKHVSASLKLELATYYELLSFAQYSSDVDEETQRIIDHGARLTELLKQGATTYLSHDLVILSLFMNRYKYIDELEVKDIRPFESFVHDQFKQNHQDLLAEINAEYKLDEQLIEKLKTVFEQLVKDYKVNTYGR
ncbi:F0F1 ATP synthase subunit alpha [Eremococcus coleocola]|uniref:ATP synthase subunit alpha n=1 Tax=Eremococcus coleocola ACS-139-V-Col8 TaxID=908337 RepID=E4KQR9_9LACT|nr:F0F1 ATP synthase subunit alpha [Eremococcus coleocola]EFR30654.1 ATP synthase F1, alpha subunit [Eremococcus coleocola ACS-139-V-Col8]